MKRLLIFAVLTMTSAICGCGRTPGSAAVSSGAAVYSTSPAATSAVTPAKPGRQEILNAFREIAFTSEYGNSTSEIRKWAEPVTIAVHGSPTDDDLATLNRAMDGLNAVKYFPGISMAGDGAHNMDIWFVPLEKMGDVVPDYVAGNWGFFTVDFKNGEIDSSAVAIATDVTDQQDRNHLILEEVLQSAGLMQDSDRYADSIFYGQWTTVQQPTWLDWELLRILYMPQIKPGMAEDEAMSVLENGYTPGSAR